jgi:hypothetical protein
MSGSGVVVSCWCCPACPADAEGVLLPSAPEPSLPEGTDPGLLVMLVLLAAAALRCPGFVMLAACPVGMLLVLAALLKGRRDDLRKPPCGCRLGRYDCLVTSALLRPSSAMDFGVTDPAGV